MKMRVSAFAPMICYVLPSSRVRNVILHARKASSTRHIVWRQHSRKVTLISTRSVLTQFHRRLPKYQSVKHNDRIDAGGNNIACDKSRMMKIRQSPRVQWLVMFCSHLRFALQLTRLNCMANKPDYLTASAPKNQVSSKREAWGSSPRTIAKTPMRET